MGLPSATISLDQNSSESDPCSAHIELDKEHSVPPPTPVSRSTSDNKPCQPFYTTLVYQARPCLSPSRKVKVREGLAAVISMREMLTNQIHFETAATPWLQYARLLLVQF